jgi:hypothetical protein
LKAIQDAERALLTASAQFETGAPSVLLRGLADCQLSIDDSEIKLGKGEVRTISVADRSRLTIPDTLDVEITAGSSVEGLSRKVKEARRRSGHACAAAGVESLTKPGRHLKSDVKRPGNWKPKGRLRRTTSGI